MPRLRRGVPVEIAGRNKDAGSEATRVIISDPLKPDKRMRGQCRACGRSEKSAAAVHDPLCLAGVVGYLRGRRPHSGGLGVVGREARPVVINPSSV